MSDPDDRPGPSRLRFVLKEAAILAVGVVLLFIALGLFIALVFPMLGWSMCCQ